MNGELNTVLKVIHKSIVIVHSLLLNVKVLGLVTIFTISLSKFSTTMIPIMMDLSILKMPSIQNTWMSYLNTVTIIMMDQLIPVKSTNVLSIVKMLGEMNTAQTMVISIVIVHSTSQPVTELGIVTIFMLSLLKYSTTMIPIMTDKSIFKTILTHLTMMS